VRFVFSILFFGAARDGRAAAAAALASELAHESFFMVSIDTGTGFGM
jgi:hypothetical protein